MLVSFSPEDWLEYQERLAAIMPAFCAPEDQLLRNLTRYWGCDDADGTLQELVEVGLLEKSPTGGYRQPIPDWTPATAQPKAIAELPTPAPVAAPATPTPHPVVECTSLMDQPVTVQSASTPTLLKPLRLSQPTVTR